MGKETLFMTIAERFADLSGSFSYPESDTDGVLADDTGLEKTQTSLIDLQTEYTRLFINAMPEVPCPPYASVYIDGSIMGPSSTAMARLYDECGISCTNDPPDHIAAEFECAAMLFAQGSASGTERQRSALISHLAGWTPLFFEKVRAHDKCGCYRHAAEIAGQLIAEAEALSLPDTTEGRV